MQSGLNDLKPNNIAKSQICSFSSSFNFIVFSCSNSQICFEINFLQAWHYFL